MQKKCKWVVWWRARALAPPVIVILITIYRHGPVSLKAKTFLLKRRPRLQNAIEFAEKWVKAQARISRCKSLHVGGAIFFFFVVVLYLRKLLLLLLCVSEKAILASSVSDLLGKFFALHKFLHVPKCKRGFVSSTGRWINNNIIWRRWWFWNIERKPWSSCAKTVMVFGWLAYP